MEFTVQSQKKIKTDLSTTDQQSIKSTISQLKNTLSSSLNEDSNSSVSAQGSKHPSDSLNKQIVDPTSSTEKHTVEIVMDSCPQPATISYEINPSPLNTCEVKEPDLRKHIPCKEWPVSDYSQGTQKAYKHMMADAMQKLALATLAMKHNPESGPYELDNVVNKFKIKKLPKGKGPDVTAQTYNNTLIDIFNHGGMDTVIERLEENLSSHLKYKPRNNKKKRKRSAVNDDDE